MSNKRNIYARALNLAIPMMIQNGIANAVGLVDNIMVGSLGTEAITGVSIAGQLVFVYSLAIFGGVSGPGIYGAQYYGKGDYEGVRMVFRLKFWVSLFIMIAAGIILYSGGESLISMYLRGEAGGLDTALTMQRSSEYLNIILISLIPFTLAQVYYTSLRECGDSFKPMVCVIIAVITDVIFNYLLIFGKFGLPRLGVQGAAIATLISRVIEILVLIVWVHFSKAKTDFLIGVYKTLKVPIEETKIIMIKGFPIFFNELLWASSQAALTQCYSLRGQAIIAGINISNALCNLLNVVFIALGSSVGILIGQMLGSGELERAKKYSTRLAWFSAGITLLISGFLFVLAPFFPEIYNTTADVKEYARWFITITAVFFPVEALLNSLYFTLRSGGKTLITFFFDSGSCWLISYPIAFFLSNYTTTSIYVILISVFAVNIFKSIVGYILVKKGVWITNLVSGEADV